MMVKYLDKIIRIIKKLGFNKWVYGETISISYRDHSIGSLMPLGVLFNGQLLYARIYRGSSMYTSIMGLNYSNISINICNDPVLFYHAIFNKDVLLGKVVYSNGVPNIKSCDAYIAAKVSRIDKYRDYIIVYMDPIKAVIKHKQPKVYNRAAFAIIEALVYYTKLQYVGKDLASKYIEMIRFFTNIVHRSSSRRIHRKIIMDILDRSMEKYKEIYG